MDERVAAITQGFSVNGVDEIPVSTGTDYIDSLVRFFRRREKMYR